MCAVELIELDEVEQAQLKALFGNVEIEVAAALLIAQALDNVVMSVDLDSFDDSSLKHVRH